MHRVLIPLLTVAMLPCHGQVEAPAQPDQAEKAAEKAVAKAVEKAVGKPEDKAAHGPDAPPPGAKEEGAKPGAPEKTAGAPAEGGAEKKPETRIFGWKEWLWIIKPDLVLRAKLDTGARTCSVHATNIETLELDGKKWVKFTISDPSDEGGKRFRHKAPVVRISKVKNDRGGLDERFVVPLTFHLGGRKMEAEFNLNDRSQMNYAVLLGRNVLSELGAVDSSRVFLLDKPKTPGKSAKRKKRRSGGK